MTEDTLKYCVGANIRKYMKQFHISCDQIARFTGIHRTTIFKYARGKRVPSIINLYKIADVFGISFSKLLDTTDYDISDEYEYGDDIYRDFEEETYVEGFEEE